MQSSNRVDLKNDDCVMRLGSSQAWLKNKTKHTLHSILYVLGGQMLWAFSLQGGEYENTL